MKRLVFSATTTTWGPEGDFERMLVYIGTGYIGSIFRPVRPFGLHPGLSWRCDKDLSKAFCYHGTNDRIFADLYDMGTLDQAREAIKKAYRESLGPAADLCRIFADLYDMGTLDQAREAIKKAYRESLGPAADLYRAPTQVQILWKPFSQDSYLPAGVAQLDDRGCVDLSGIAHGIMAHKDYPNGIHFAPGDKLMLRELPNV